MNELWPWLKVMRRRQTRLLVGALLMALALLAGLGLLGLSGWFITASATAGLLLAAGVSVAFDVYVPGGGIRFFALTRTLARYAERVYNHDTVLRLLADLRVRLFRGLATQSAAHRADHRHSDWLSRLTNDLDRLDSLYLRLLAPGALAVVFTLGLVLMAFWVYSGTVALAVGTLLTLALLTATVLTHRMTRELSGQRVDKLERIRGRSIEHLEAQAELCAAGCREGNQVKLLGWADSLSEEQAHMDERIGWCATGSGFLLQLALVVALWLGLGLFQSDQITGPVLVALPLVLLGLNELYSALPDAFGRLGGIISAATRLNRDMGVDRKAGSPHPTPHPTPSRTQTPQAAISWRRAGFGYRPDLPLVVKNWSLDVKPGERVGILGSSGSGKSSLADMAAGLLEPIQGACWRGGRPGEQPAWRDWSRQISYLTQSTQLLDDSLRNNLLLGAPDASEERLWRVLEAVDLTNLALTLPQKLDTWLGAYGRQVSGGEARRIALARVLLKPAKLVILDEPFTGLDRVTRNKVRNGIAQLLRGKTVLAFAHAAEALPNVDRQITIAKT